MTVALDAKELAGQLERGEYEKEEEADDDADQDFTKEQEEVVKGPVGQDVPSLQYGWKNQGG